MTRSAIRRPADPNESGFSLIEVMIAMFIIGVGVAALASVAITSISSVRISRERQDAMQLASTILEDARSFDYGRVALDSDTYSGPGTYDGQVVHVLSDGEVPHEVVEGPLTARTWVTWENAAQTEKRVTTVVSWFDRGQNRQVVQSTRIAEARRGLPVPNFQLEPALVAADGTPGQTVCFDHTLTNLGERDSYSWQLFHDDGSGGVTAAQSHTRNVVENGVTVTRQGFKIAPSGGPGQGWFAWMRMGPTVSTLQPMTDLTSDGRPDSASPVGRRAQAIVRICYTARDSSGNLNVHDQQATFTIRMFSAFDETIVRDVQDSLRVVANRTTLYLHHLYQNNGVPRTNHQYKLLMDRLPPTRTDGTINFDKDSGNGDQNPGLLVPGATAVLFDYQNVETVTRTLLAEPARVQIAAATDASLAGPPTQDTKLQITAALEKFVPGSGSSGTTTPLGQATTLIDPESNGWTLGEVEIPVISTSIAQNQYLRLRLTCTVPNTAEACHIHYDVANLFESRLEVTLQ